MGHEGGAGVHEDADEDGHHGEGDDVDVEHVVADHQRGDDREQQDERVEHGQRARLLEEVLAEELQEDGEADEQQSDVEDLAQYDEAELGIVLMTAVVLAEVRLQDVVGVLVDNVASADNLLSALGDAAGQGNACQQIIQTGIATLFVVAEVGHVVVVEVTFYENRLVV